jgi:hypothetical protein
VVAAEIDDKPDLLAAGGRYRLPGFLDNSDDEIN